MKLSILIKKELMEIVKTYKIYVIPVVFLIFGMLSPIIAKVMPDIIDSMAGDMGGIRIEIPPATWIDAFAQYFKNLSQIGLLAVILTIMGTVSDEKSRGTILMVLSRPVLRYAVILAKVIAHVLLLVVSVFISYLACLYYTYLLFPDVNLAFTIEATLVFLVYVLFITSLTIFSSSIAKSNVVAGGIAIFGFFIVSVLPGLHRIFARYSPGALSSYAYDIIGDKVPFQDTFSAIWITIFISIMLIIIGSLVFSKQEL